MPKSKARLLAEKLLNQHLEHEMAHLDPKVLLEELRQDVDICFEATKDLTLNDVVQPESIKAIINRHVVERDMPPIALDMAAQFTADIVDADFHKATTPGDLVSRHQVEEFVDQALLLKDQREQLINVMLEQPLYKDMIANVLYEGIARYVYDENLISRKIPGVSSALKFSSKMLNKAVSGLDEAWEKSVKGYISRNVESLARHSARFLQENLTDEEIRISALDAWDRFAQKPMQELQAGLGDIEWREFVVLGYGYWLELRQTDYFRQCYETVVDNLFEEYGDRSLAELADEFTITPELIMTEAETVLPHGLENLRKNGLVEALLKRRLERFYLDKNTLALLKDELA